MGFFVLSDLRRSSREKLMKAIFNMIVVAFFLLPSTGYGEVKEIISEGTYNMGDGETPTVAESRALFNAKRAAIEQAGTYIESYSKVKNFQLAHDEIQVLASGVMEVIVLQKKRTVVGDGFNFWVKIKATLSTDKIEEMAKRIKDKSSAEDYRGDLKQLQESYEKLTREIEILKSQLKEAKSGKEKQQVETKITDSEKLFQANDWFEKGRKEFLNKEYENAIRSYTSAISLNPNFPLAYNNRGFTFWRKGEYDKTIEDCSKAISLNPNPTDLAMAYNNGPAS
jgi:tetratricopeptide (TPR) repeat protein